MTHPRTTPQAAKPGLSRLRPVVSCVVRAAALLALACFASLLVPVCIEFSSFGLNAHVSQAIAYEGDTQMSYINEMASEAGLSDSVFVATTIGALSATTGMVLTSNPGVRIADATLGDNLDNLISAANYPPWEDLTTEQQSAYGTKTNYDSTKYVALMEAFDLDDGYSRFAETGSSGGGFVFTPAESQRLKNIGNVGKYWANSIGKSIGDLRNLLVPDYSDILYKYLYGSGSGSGNGEMEYTGEGSDSWVSGDVLYYKVTNAAWVRYNNHANLFYKVQSVTDVYIAFLERPNNGGYMWALFSKGPFIYGSNNTTDVSEDIYIGRAAEQQTDKFGHEFYYAGVQVGFDVVNESSQTINHLSRDLYLSDMGNILYGESGSESGGSGELVPDIEGYPETEVPDNTTVYYPEQGIQPSTTWNQYITVQRPDNPFNPDDQTSTPEWQQETKQNIQGLQGIRFDKLFPFCLYYDLQKFWQKVQTICGIQTTQNGTISTQASSAYDEIELRFYIPDVMDDTWTFDLEPLRNILLIIKPFMLVFLIGVEIISLIMLWKGILTGQ